MVLLSKISSLFVKILICDMVIAEFADVFNILLWCMQSECVHALTHRIKTIKTFINYIRCYCLKFITKKHEELV